MVIIQEIYQNDIGFEKSEETMKYEVRKSARAVILTEKNKVAVLYVSRDNYYKLPGGGAERNETILETLEREVLEEVGCNIDVIDEIGLTIEYRDKFEQIQMSYSYLCRTRGELCATQFTQSELDHGFELVWLDLEKAVEVMSSYNGNEYLASFIKFRDSNIIERADKIIKRFNWQY